MCNLPFVSFACLPPASHDRRDETPASQTSLFKKARLGYSGQNYRKNLSRDLYESVKTRRKSLCGKGFQLQMGKTPFAKNRIGMERYISAARSDFVGAVLPGCGDFRKSPRAYDDLLKKASRISDARFRFAKSELHGCGDFRKSPRPFRRINGNLTRIDGEINLNFDVDADNILAQKFPGRI